jgi:hypothetical protein
MNHVLHFIASSLPRVLPRPERPRIAQESRAFGARSSQLVSVPWEGLYLEEGD